jgi:hypothetical protein
MPGTRLRPQPASITAQSASVAAALRQARLESRRTQAEIAGRTRISRSTLSRLERALPRAMHLPTILAVGEAPGRPIEVRVGGHPLDRPPLTRDAASAAVIERMVAQWTAAGWRCETDFWYQSGAARGWADFVAYHPANAVLAIVEVKTALVDNQETLGIFKRKIRFVPGEWEVVHRTSPRSVAALLVVTGTSRNRAVLRQHRLTFAASFPDTIDDLDQWIRQPTAPVSSVVIIPSGALPRSVPEGARRRAPARGRPAERPAGRPEPGGRGRTPASATEP